ncbi:hypothetical protein [Noviherbaspirillum agri]
MKLAHLGVQCVRRGEDADWGFTQETESNPLIETLDYTASLHASPHRAGAVRTLCYPRRHPIFPAQP